MKENSVQSASPRREKISWRRLLDFPIVVAICLFLWDAVPAFAAPPSDDTPDTKSAVAEKPIVGKKELAPQGPPPGDPLGPDLFAAIRKNDAAQVQSLLDHGAKIDNPNWLGLTPILWAAYTGKEAACAVLLRNNADFRIDTVFGGALEAAEMGGNPRIVRLLLDHGATFSKNRSDQISAVITAAEAGHAEILTMLLNHEGKVNKPDAMGMTALMHASRRGQIQTASLLLRAGANVNEIDTYGRTALMYAALNGHANLVTQLLAAGAGIDSKDKKGDTALILAARYSGDANIARLLKGHGAAVAVRDARNRTVSETARAHGYTEFASILDGGLQRVANAKPANVAIQARQAVQRSLPLIERTTAKFSAKGGCNS